MACDASIIFVSDYKAGEDKSWNDMRAALSALAEQDFDGSVEVLLVEEERYISQIPEDLATLHPNLKIVSSTKTNSYALANVGVDAADSEFVVLLDADCIPAKAWLQHCIKRLRSNQMIGVVSGKTRYPGESLRERCLALLSRSYVVPSDRQATRHISNNNAGFRRAIFLQYPLPESSGIYASRLQAIAIERGGWTMAFEPGMEVIHDFEGWNMERDIRHQMAHNLISMRQADPSLPYAWVANMGVIGLPVYFVGRLLQQWNKCIRVPSHFGVRAFEVPVAMALAVWTSALELPGALRALRSQPVRDTVYR
ncbi:glycosyltransferase [Thiosocius teredinicola]|uniref:glycosyltransferase n=1 Tax=Thiosocius teredinicola TaxID=1973002 RepID=UPI000990A255